MNDWFSLAKVYPHSDKSCPTKINFAENADF